MFALAALAVGSFAAATRPQTQEAAKPGVETGVLLHSLFLPTYPPLARQARIVGDVKIQVRVRRDGSVDSSAVISGHPMLKQAALESAQKSTFECKGCTDMVTPLVLTYSFGYRDDPDGYDCDVTRLRAAKCLYLWRCGLWRGKDLPKPAVGHSADHIMILAESPCLETDTAR
jgi:TonB family protein